MEFTSLLKRYLADRANIASTSVGFSFSAFSTTGLMKVVQNIEMLLQTIRSTMWYYDDWKAGLAIKGKHNHWLVDPTRGDLHNSLTTEIRNQR